MRTRQSENHPPDSHSTITLGAIAVALLPLGATLGPWLSEATGAPVYRLATALSATILGAQLLSGGADRKWLTWPAGILIIWLTVGIARTAVGVEDPQSAFSALLLFALNGVILLGVYRRSDQAILLKWGLGSWYLTVLLVVAICAWESSSGRHLSNVSVSVLDGDPTLLSGPFGNPNALAFYICITIPLLVIAAFSSEIRISARLASAIAIVALIIVLVQTESVIAQIALLLEAAAFVVLFKRELRLARAATLIAATMVPLLILGLYVSSVPNHRFRAMLSNFASLNTLIEGVNGEKNTVGVRISLADQAVSLSLLKPLSGFGPGQFAATMQSTGDPNQTALILSPHNALAELGVEFGFPVFLMILAVTAAVLFSTMRTSRSDSPTERRFGVACVVQLMAQLPLIAANSTYLQSPWVWTWATLVILGCSGAASHHLSKKDASRQLAG